MTASALFGEFNFSAPVESKRSGGVASALPLESIFEKFSTSNIEVEKPKIWSDYGNEIFHETDEQFVIPGTTPNDSPGSVTISPQELLSSSSTTVSNSFGELDYSPLFTDSADFSLPSNTNTWESLFHDGVVSVEESSPAPAPAIPTVKKEYTTSPAASPAIATPDMKKESSPEAEGSKKRKRSYTKSPSAYNAKKDEFGITMYSRKPRSQPLAPIVIDEDDDSIQSKRAKNTEAARRSRARKMERMIQLEEKLRELAQANSELQKEVDRLKAICGES